VIDVEKTNKKTSTIVVLSIVVAAVVAGVISAGISLASAPNPQLPPATEPPRERIIWMEAVEYKGATEVQKLAPPTRDPEDVGPAFEFKWVEPNKKWQVSAYAFTPSTVVVNQGDKVTLRIFGVNGNLHKVYVERYSPNIVELNRGRFIDITFTADKAGLFQIVCTNHEPAMRGWLIVLPRAG